MRGTGVITTVGLSVLILSSAAVGQQYGPPHVQRGQRAQDFRSSHDCTASAGNVVANCSFETGDFTNWVANDLSDPFFELTVDGPTSIGFDFFTSAPTQGDVSALNGFDGNGPGTIELGQDLTVPTSGVLAFDYRGAWDLKNEGDPTLDRTFEVHVEPSGGGEPMLTDLILTAEVGTVVLDTGSQSATIDLSAFGGQAVRVNFVWTVPEFFTGPAFFDLDNVQLASSVSPMALVVDSVPLPASDGNGVFEPGEEVEVAPAWRNDGESPLLLEGTASGFDGPAGPDYVLVSDEADYGEIGAGATASCQDSGMCYAMQVGPQGTPRPATHWEATFEEDLSAGWAKTWTLHIGRSFTDVPPTDVFYSSIETLLHSGVTGGCTGSEYCPGGANSRAQMPVFVLRALEGDDYTPLPCVEGDDPFGDVPFDSTFCPWIQDLAGRGIVSGCGDGDYCPGNPVTRAQMAIFLLKTLEGAGYEPPGCTELFTDVPCPSLFADWIEDLAARDITGGCSETEYCPADAVTRAQMAVFVTRTFELTLYGP